MSDQVLGCSSLYAIESMVIPLTHEFYNLCSPHLILKLYLQLFSLNDMTICRYDSVMVPSESVFLFENIIS